MKLVLLILFSYLIGSIPFSYLFSRLKGHDVREKGSKNVGATNAFVVGGAGIGILSLAGDVFKGIFAILLARYFSLPAGGIALCALAVIIGHDFPVFLKFRGGKGVATLGGVLLALDPIFTLLVILLWVLCILIFQYFIPSSVLVICFIPAMMWMGSWRWEYLVFAVINAGLGIFVHRQDLRRFFAGEELNISQSIAKYRMK
jgi:glycerol-3-phosphate acyltransferase PlsY